MKFKIKAKPGAQIQTFTSAYERRGAVTRGWSVTRYYRDGEAHCEPQAMPDSVLEGFLCDPQLGFALGQPVLEEFDFDETFSEKERNELIEAQAVPSKFSIEEEYILVKGPVDLELVRE